MSSRAGFEDGHDFRSTRRLGVVVPWLSLLVSSSMTFGVPEFQNDTQEGDDMVTVLLNRGPAFRDEVRSRAITAKRIRRVMRMHGLMLVPRVHRGHGRPHLGQLA